MPTKTGPSNISASWFGTSVRRNGDSIPNSGSQTVLRNRTVTFGDNLSDWKARIKASKSATTSLTGTGFTYRPPYYNFTARHPAPETLPPSSTTIVFRNINGYPLVFPSGTPDGTAGVDFSRADNRALASFVQKAVGARRSMQGGVFLGELKRTIAMVKNPAQAIRSGLDDYVSALKKKRPLIARSHPSSRRRTAQSIVSDSWLEYSFGAVPLFLDVQDAAVALAKSRILADKPRTVFVSASGRDSSGQGKWTTVDQQTQNGLIANTAWSTETYYSVKYYGKVKVFHPSSLQAQLGLLPSDFVPTMWELVPWSFLVDYFSNVGDIIQAACLMRSDIAWAARGWKFATETRMRTFPSLSSLTTHILTGPKTEGSFSVSEVSRSKYVGSLIPSLDFEIPGAGRKWINMAALANSMRSLRPFHLL